MKYLGTKNIVGITGINKTFNLAGLAVTHVIVEDEGLLAKMPQSHGGCTPFGIAATIAAYTEGDAWVDELNEYLDDVIDYAIDRFHKELPKIRVWRPEGTYILWLDFQDFGLSEDELNQKLAGEAHLGFSDGAGLEADEGEMYRRMCITCPKSVVKEAIDRMVRVLG